MRLGIILRKWRLMFEADVKDVAREIGISASTLTRIENGSFPDGATLIKLISFLLAPDAPIKKEAEPAAAIAPDTVKEIMDREESGRPTLPGLEAITEVGARA